MTNAKTEAQAGYPVAEALPSPVKARSILDPESRTPKDDRYAELVRRVKAAGLLEKRGRLYVLRCVVTAAFFAAGWIAFFAVGNSWWQVAVAVYLAIAFTQMGFLGHDGGHRQAFKSRRNNDILLLAAANLGIGVASGWWFSNHNRHHAHPNDITRDPDAGLRYYAYSHEQTPTKRGMDKITARYQHILYFPFLCLLGFSLHLESAMLVLRRQVPRAFLEGVLIFTHTGLYTAAVLTTLSWPKAIVFVLVQQMLFGLYLGSTFAPNHKGMEMFNGDEHKFIDRQVLSSRNVRGNAVMSYIFGGLNHQIEHHLFPSMPRPNLVKAKPIVEAYLAEVGLPYAEDSMWGSFGQVVAHFKSTRA